MKKIIAIALISLRAAIRSRIVICLIAILLLVIIGLPLTVKGDGTLSGQIQILLTYTLGVVMFILSMTTLWAGCAAIAQEISERQIQLVLAKPVGRLQVWLGKWLGLLALNAALLLVSGATVYGLLAWNTRATVLTPAESRELNTDILVARRVVLPDFPDVSSDARRMLDEQLREMDAPPPADLAPFLEAAEGALLTRRYTAPPGAELQWTLPLPHSVPATQTLAIRFKFAIGVTGHDHVRGHWTIGGPHAPEQVSVERDDTANAFHTIHAPATTIGPDGTLQVSFRNAHPIPVPLSFTPEDGLALLMPAGTFEGNLARALLIHFAHLALLAAVGVTAGSLLSMPVAALVSLYTVVVMRFIPYIETMASRTRFFGGPDDAAAQPFVDLYLALAFKTLHFLSAPLQTPNPLNALGLGHLVPWGDVLQTMLIKVVVYAGCLCLVGGWLFNRREIALPSS